MFSIGPISLSIDEKDLKHAQQFHGQKPGGVGGVDVGGAGGGGGWSHPSLVKQGTAQCMGDKNIYTKLFQILCHCSSLQQWMSMQLLTPSCPDLQCIKLLMLLSCKHFKIKISSP